LLAFGAIALLGIGCKSPQARLEERIQLAKEQAIPSVTTPDVATTTETAPTPAPAGSEAPEPSADIVYLRQVMRNLGQATAFRAVIDVPVQGGTADIAVDFAAAVGLYGRMRIDVDNTLTISDVFMSKDEIDFRENTSTWTNITDTKEATVLRALFQEATLPSGGAESFVSEYAQMQDRIEDTDCTLYTFKQYNEINAQVELYQICVKGDLPTYIITESPFGQQRIDYKDINNFVDVQHP